MKKTMTLTLVLALAALAVAQGDHVPAYRDPAPASSQLMPILPADQRVGENFKYPYQVHAYELAICMKEVYYAYQQTKMKKTPSQIRDGIIRGDWKAIDLESAVSVN